MTLIEHQAGPVHRASGEADVRNVPAFSRAFAAECRELAEVFADKPELAAAFEAEAVKADALAGS